jgi:hypothetical protein
MKEYKKLHPNEKAEIYDAILKGLYDDIIEIHTFIEKEFMERKNATDTRDKDNRDDSINITE